jgi:hypothetical protein
LATSPLLASLDPVVETVGRGSPVAVATSPAVSRLLESAPSTVARVCPGAVRVRAAEPLVLRADAAVRCGRADPPVGVAGLTGRWVVGGAETPWRRSGGWTASGVEGGQRALERVNLGQQLVKARLDVMADVIEHSGQLLGVVPITENASDQPGVRTSGCAGAAAGRPAGISLEPCFSPWLSGKPVTVQCLRRRRRPGVRAGAIGWVLVSRSRRRSSGREA